MYVDKIKALLSPTERKIFQKLTTPQKIQDYLDKLPINYEHGGETYMSPRRMLKAKTAHCFEGALFAAAALACGAGADEPAAAALCALVMRGTRPWRRLIFRKARRQ